MDTNDTAAAAHTQTGAAAQAAPTPVDSSAQTASPSAAAPSAPSAPAASATPAAAAAAASPTPTAAAAAAAPAGSDDDDEEIAVREGMTEEEMLADAAPKKRKGKAAAASAAPAAASTGGAPPSDALDRLEELLRKTEQFSKFLATAPQKKGSAHCHNAAARCAMWPTAHTRCAMSASSCACSRRGGGRHHERAEEDAEDKELVADELQQVEGVGQSWPDHLDEQPTSVVKDKGMAMRDYQLEALNWLIKLHDQKLNGILADEMGSATSRPAHSVCRLASAAVCLCRSRKLAVCLSCAAVQPRQDVDVIEFVGLPEAIPLLRWSPFDHRAEVDFVELVARGQTMDQQSLGAQIPWKSGGTRPGQATRLAARHHDHDLRNGACPSLLCSFR
jgi:hypothetical protein